MTSMIKQGYRIKEAKRYTIGNFILMRSFRLWKVYANLMHSLEDRGILPFPKKTTIEKRCDNE